MSIISYTERCFILKACTSSGL